MDGGPPYEGPQGAFGQSLSYEDLQEISNIVVGSPDTIIHKLRAVIERLNPGYLHIYGNEGDMSHGDTLRSIELLGREVIPALHEIPLHPFD